jgi:hypothetical protein
MRQADIPQQSIQIALTGRSRSKMLDAVGKVVGVLGAFAALGFLAVLASEWGDMTSDERGSGVVLALGVIFGYFVVVAIFLGFAALVLNSSQSLLLQALDSGLNDDE